MKPPAAGEDWVAAGLAALAAVLATLGFVYQGFVTGDAYRYATGTLELSRLGPGHLRGVFNGEVCFGYYGLLSALRTVGGSHIPLSDLMNYLSVASAIVATSGFALLFVRLTGSRVLGLGAALLTLLSCSFWYQGLYGNPGMAALAWFALALWQWNHLVERGLAWRGARLRWVAVVLLYAIALSLRLDMVLGTGAFIGLFLYRRSGRRRAFAGLIAMLLLAVLLALSARALALGGITQPSGGTLFMHLTQRLSLPALPDALIKNTGWWIVGTGPLVAALAAIAALQSARSGLLALTLLWVLPYLVFLPFQGMATSRLMMPTVPALAVATVQLRVGRFMPGRARQAEASAMPAGRRAWLLIGLMLIVNLAAAHGMGLLVGRMAAFRKAYRGFPIANEAVAFVPWDRHFRQPFVQARDEIARRVAAVDDTAVLCIALDDPASYEYHVTRLRPSARRSRAEQDGAVLFRQQTETNDFWYFTPNENAGAAHPLQTALAFGRAEGARVHVTPFSTILTVAPDPLFLDEGSLARLLASETEILGQRRSVFR
ncbi:MAG: hypothetical protein V1774_08345 [Candidatus Eisenbacteria bacterium]